jgi:hypothetical protein
MVFNSGLAKRQALIVPHLSFLHALVRPPFFPFQVTLFSNPLTSLLDGTQTQLLASPSSPTLSMNVEVPGGQQAYIASDGSFSITQAHSASTGSGGQRETFTYTPQTEDGTVGKLQFNNNDWVACPVDREPEGVYKIFADAVPQPAAGLACINIVVGTARVGSELVWQFQ